MSHNRPALEQNMLEAQYLADLQHGVGKTNVMKARKSTSPARRNILMTG